MCASESMGGGCLVYFRLIKTVSLLHTKIFLNMLFYSVCGV